MIGRKFTTVLAALALLALVYGGRGSASELSAPRSLMLAGFGDILPNCDTLDVTSLTPNVSSIRSEVQFQVHASLWCNWTASSSLITDISITDGVGSQVVTGTIPANLDEQSGRTAYFQVASWNRKITRTATVSQAACCVRDCTGVSAQPQDLWPPGGFISVTVPAGWSWQWDPYTDLMRYHCYPNYPTGVYCAWDCSTIEPRHGSAAIHAWGDGRACDIGIGGDQTRCPEATPTPSGPATR